VSDELSGEKIAFTGLTGQIGRPMALHLARSNEVWGLARFGDEAVKAELEAGGVTTRQVDLASGDLSGVPDDFTYVIHLAAFQGGGLDYDHAIRVNAEGTGLLLHHCRKAKAALVASTFSAYKPVEQSHAYAETDPLGDANATHSPAYSVSKIGEEAVARTLARALDLPVTIARINASYGPNGGLPAYHLDWMLAGQPIALRAPGHTPYSPIHQDDMNRQASLLLQVASVPATIVNWAGDDVVTPEAWCGWFADLTGVTPRFEYREYPGASIGAASDNTRRRALIGDCLVRWRDGMRSMFEARYPNGPTGGPAGGHGADALLQSYQD
jgi:UDP-glucuronate 4-epimerase